MFGYFGKMPGHGDFVRSRVSPGFVAGWDRWLQAGLGESRARLGAGWRAAYEAMPIWRFALPPGVCGADPVLGVMMPSQDRVGRLFPLTLLWRGQTPVGAAALDQDPLMSDLEEAALSVLDGAPQADLRARLDAMAQPRLAGGSDGATHWLSTFFEGRARRDTRRFSALPPAHRFTEFLNPGLEGADD